MNGHKHRRMRTFGASKRFVGETIQIEPFTADIRSFQTVRRRDDLFPFLVQHTIHARSYLLLPLYHKKGYIALRETYLKTPDNYRDNS